MLGRSARPDRTRREEPHVLLVAGRASAPAYAVADQLLDAGYRV